MRFSTIFCVIASSAVAFAAAIPRDGAPGPNNANPAPNNVSPAPSNATPAASNTDTNGSSDVPTVFNNIVQQTETPLSEFDNCAGDDCTEQAVSDLKNVLNNCPTTVAPIPSGTGDDSDATPVVEFVKKVVNGLKDHKTACGTDKCPKLDDTYAEVDPPLSKCLAAVFNLRPALPNIISPEVPDLKAPLQDMGFEETLATLKLA